MMSSTLTNNNNHENHHSSSSLVLLEFIEIVIHQYLYTRGVYPRKVFEAKQKYGIRVWIARHPELTSYIHDMCQSLQPLVDKQVLKKLLVRVINTSSVVLEELAIEFQDAATSSSYSSRLWQNEFASFLVSLQCNSAVNQTDVFCSDNLSFDLCATTTSRTTNKSNKAILWNSDDAIWIPEEQQDSSSSQDYYSIRSAQHSESSFQVYVTRYNTDTVQ